MKNEIELEVVTTSHCSFIPFTGVPDSWKGKKVRIVLLTEEKPFELETDNEAPWK